MFRPDRAANTSRPRRSISTDPGSLNRDPNDQLIEGSTAPPTTPVLLNTTGDSSNQLVDGIASQLPIIPHTDEVSSPLPAAPTENTFSVGNQLPVVHSVCDPYTEDYQMDVDSNETLIDLNEADRINADIMVDYRNGYMSRDDFPRGRTLHNTNWNTQRRGLTRRLRQMRERNMVQQLLVKIARLNVEGTNIASNNDAGAGADADADSDSDSDSDTETDNCLSSSDSNATDNTIMPTDDVPNVNQIPPIIIVDPASTAAHQASNSQGSLSSNASMATRHRDTRQPPPTPVIPPIVLLSSDALNSDSLRLLSTPRTTPLRVRQRPSSGRIRRPGRELQSNNSRRTLRAVRAARAMLPANPQEMTNNNNNSYSLVPSVGNTQNRQDDQLSAFLNNFGNPNSYYSDMDSDEE